MLKGISIKAVLIGLLVTLGLSFLGGIVLGMGLVVYMTNGFTNTAHVDMEAMKEMNTSLSMMLLCIALSIGVCLIGGALTGWIASINRMKNSFVMSVGLLILTAPFALLAPDYPVWYQVTAVIVTVAFTVLGGWIADLIFGNKPPVEPVPSLM